MFAVPTVGAASLPCPSRACSAPFGVVDVRGLPFLCAAPRILCSTPFGVVDVRGLTAVREVVRGLVVRVLNAVRRRGCSRISPCRLPRTERSSCAQRRSASWMFAGYLSLRRPSHRAPTPQMCSTPFGVVDVRGRSGRLCFLLLSSVLNAVRRRGCSRVVQSLPATGDKIVGSAQRRSASWMFAGEIVAKGTGELQVECSTPFGVVDIRGNCVARPQLSRDLLVLSAVRRRGCSRGTMASPSGSQSTRQCAQRRSASWMFAGD